MWWSPSTSRCWPRSTGWAWGSGCTLLAHVDLVLMDDEAPAAGPFAEMGVPPEAASSWLLPERMGWQRASAMLLASEWIDADQAVAAGLALRVCPAGTVLDETMDLARRIASFPPHATREIKRLMMAARRPADRRRPGPGRRRPSPPCSPIPPPIPGPGSPPAWSADRRAPRYHRLPHRPGHGPGRPGPGGRGARLPLALPPRAHPPPGAGRPRRRPWSRGCTSTTTGAASTRSWPWPRRPRSPTGSCSAPGWCWPPSTTRSCWPSRSPPSTT